MSTEVKKQHRGIPEATFLVNILTFFLDFSNYCRQRVFLLLCIFTHNHVQSHRHTGGFIVYWTVKCNEPI